MLFCAWMRTSGETIASPANAALQEQLRCAFLEVARLTLELEEARRSSAARSGRQEPPKGGGWSPLSCTVGEAGAPKAGAPKAAEERPEHYGAH